MKNFHENATRSIFQETKASVWTSLLLASFALWSCSDNPKVERRAPQGFQVERVESTSEFGAVEVPSEGQPGVIPPAGAGGVTVETGAGGQNGSPTPESGTNPTAGGSVGTASNGADGKPSQAAGTSGLEFSEFDQNFCKGLPQGACFSLVFQIPSEKLSQSLGVSVLGLSRYATSYRGVFQKNCDEGLKVSWKHLLADQGVQPLHRQGVWKKAFGKAAKLRCVYQGVDSEVTPPPLLEQNESAMSVKLVDFGLESKSTSTSPAFGTFEFKKSKMTVTYRDPQAFVRLAPSLPKSWQPLAGFSAWRILRQNGVFPTATRRIDVENSLVFDFNLIGSANYLQRVILPSLDTALQGEGIGKLGAQVALIRNQLKTIQAGARGALPYFIIAAIGVDALRDFCKGDGVSCKIKETGSNVADVISRYHSNNQTLPAQTKALFVDSTKYIPFAVASSLVEGMDKKEFLKKFQ